LKENTLQDEEGLYFNPYGNRINQNRGL
jgi:hypothetical protein